MGEATLETSPAPEGRRFWATGTVDVAGNKRLSGLPDDFKLSGAFAQKAERIGRMVPPLMTKAIAEAVYERVLKPAKANLT